MDRNFQLQQKSVATIDIFQTLRISLDEAREAKNHLIAKEAALNNGFTKEDLTHGLTVKYLFRYEDNEDGKIEMEWRSYDPSGPFQNLPDMNKIELKCYIKSQLIDQYQVEYED